MKVEHRAFFCLTTTATGNRGLERREFVVLEVTAKPFPGDLQVPLLELLADPANAELSNREIARRLHLDHKFVAGFRAALAAVAWAPVDPGVQGPATLGPSPNGLPTTLPRPPSGTRSTPGHTVAGEPPALNSYDSWALATPDERTKFVDGVGLHHLLGAAPVDHREHFLRQVGGAVAP